MLIAPRLGTSLSTDGAIGYGSEPSGMGFVVLFEIGSWPVQVHVVGKLAIISI